MTIYNFFFVGSECCSEEDQQHDIDLNLILIENNWLDGISETVYHLRSTSLIMQ